jgi:putative colanic acid biosynthesis glycosyltransferase
LKGLQKTIKSLKIQKFKDFEVWVIDGGSTIETQDYLNTLEKPFFYQSRGDKGIYDAMNKGISLSKGEWLYFLGTGDFLNNETVFQEISEHLLSNEYSIISGSIVYEGKSKPFVYSKNKMVKTPFWSFSMWFRNGLHHQGTFYKAALFRDNKYPLKYKILSDYWLNLYFFKRNIPCKIIKTVIAKCNSDGVSKEGSWSIYKEEIDLKIELSSVFFSPFFHIIAYMKFLSRKAVND